ncbi:urease accessory protein UreD [Mycolicibacterium sp. P1-18]|uniref:urease accessory protein UreD n=1 Tax=Mycolicibacterium sp. P1-18 TaxID=2024615 RepID=UPI0011F19189|nr:urease accessory protein UreD [Mycolicibacterium sp. P1-18]
MTQALDLVLARVGGRTVLTRRRYRWPLLVGRVFDDDRGGVLTVQNAAGTLIPGDVIRQSIAVVDGGVATVRGQGATTISGTPTGAEAFEDTRLDVDATGELWYSPAPRIVTPRARYRQELRVAVEPGGRAVVVDAVVLHPECGDADFGSYASTVEVRGPERQLLAVDAQSLDAMPTARRAPSAFGTVYLIGLDDAPTEVGSRDAYSAVTELPNGAGWAVRIAARDGGALRAALDDVLSVVRSGGLTVAG